MEMAGLYADLDSRVEYLESFGGNREGFSLTFNRLSAERDFSRSLLLGKTVMRSNDRVRVRIQGNPGKATFVDYSVGDFKARSLEEIESAVEGYKIPSLSALVGRTPVDSRPSTSL